MRTKKAGCILIDKKTKKIALVCRKGEFSFPKGHLEERETLQECAVRETIEETGHDCHLSDMKEIAIIDYITSKGEDVENYMYIAIDDGITKQKINEKDREKTVWEEFDKIEETLSNNNLKEFWNEVKERVKKVMESE